MPFRRRPSRTGRLAGTTIQDQTRQALANGRAVLQEGDATLDDFPVMNEEYASWFPSGPPCRSVATLGAVIPGVPVSIRMTAIRPRGSAAPPTR